MYLDQEEDGTSNNTLQGQGHRNDIIECLHHLEEKDAEKKMRTITKKLIEGKLRLPQEKEGYINLITYTLIPEEDEILKMGINCHCFTQQRPLDKSLEIESLTDNSQGQEDLGNLQTTDALQPLLLSEALTDQGDYKSNVIDWCLREAAKQLREKEDITVRRADKTAAFVLINTEDYHRKLDDILADSTKFRRIANNPVNKIRWEANRIIETVNATSHALLLPPITGDCDLGYIYGNVKTHKRGNPLHLIISQIPALTYQLAKRLNAILTPYIQGSHSLKSSAEFLEALRVVPPGGCICPMDVECLFTSVPINETIQMILDRVFRDPTTPSLNIPEHALCASLEICTEKALFSNHCVHMYTQIDGVAVGSPLGVLFTNFYMGTVEHRVFEDIDQPRMCLRYIDDTFVSANSQEEIENQWRAFHNHSCLSFTIEHSQNCCLPFLDVLV
ncbi:uncharacterized protein [Macrobrachium rosenbergii]|uniref:uncharacterized protein n=1 Tax=Macrobrachium rosenbergii TaxID=79674 RepID=UPI0034D65363